MLAAMAAKHIHAPNSSIFFETGSVDSSLDELPMAVADPRVMHLAAVNGCLTDAFAFMQNPWTGKRVVGILGAAQIDLYGNLNSTVIGKYDNPRIRFSGSGGASDVASFVSRTIVFMKHEKRKFVEKLDYLTSPGWLTGGSSRSDAGLGSAGPETVVTDLAVMGFHEDSKRMVLKSFYHGVSISEIMKKTGFEMDTTGAAVEPPPTRRELKILKERCDPQGLILR
jgi:glutaconate CoA-transferase subunit B